jgi:hypothetical protein
MKQEVFTTIHKVYQKIEKTVFRPKDGTQAEILKWLLRKNAVRIKPIFK